ncbi:MAG: radical SAM protein [Thermoleophilia bacterium]
MAAAVNAALTVSSHSPGRSARVFARGLQKLAKTDQQRMIADWLYSYMAPGSPGEAFFKRLTQETNRNARRRYLAGFIAHLVMRDQELSRRLEEEWGVNAPYILAISPSMRCNLRCRGCYAGEYDRRDDLPFELVDRVVSEAESIGTGFFILIGGEPFMWPHTLELAERHQDSAFQPYTNATMITDEVADRLAELGNVCPAISIEGLRDRTDERRGAGTFDRVLEAMARLKERGVIFAFSTTVTSENLDEVISDEFVDLMIEMGAMYGWYFNYIPVGSDPDLTYMPTPEERDRLRRGVIRIRDTKPILVADFWNDGAFVGGCMAAGRKYLHITNEGDVEPCVFYHFAVDNIKEKTLVECLASDFFKNIRSLQPFGHDLLRPCPIIDHPGVIRRMVEKHGAYPTHPGAESIITDLQPGLKQYAAEMRELYSPVWKEEYAWVQRYLAKDPAYQARLRKGREADLEVEEETAAKEGAGV